MQRKINGLIGVLQVTHTHTVAEWILTQSALANIFKVNRRAIRCWGICYSFQVYRMCFDSVLFLGEELWQLDESFIVAECPLNGEHASPDRWVKWSSVILRPIQTLPTPLLPSAPLTQLVSLREHGEGGVTGSYHDLIKLAPTEGGV